jgi:hypothetical protein
MSTGKNETGKRCAAETPIRELLNRFTLIAGEVNSGKTALTRRILEVYVREQGGPLTVVDLAPRLGLSPTAADRSNRGVGGVLEAPMTAQARRFDGPVRAPRLKGRDAEEALQMASENARVIECIFREALQAEAKALFINDCSLYLHAGDPRKMLAWIRSADTAVVNGYYGDSLGGGPISIREKKGMNFLMRQCDRLIRLSNFTAEDA